MDDPLSPQNINPSWGDTPTSSTFTTDQPISSFSSSTFSSHNQEGVSNGNGFEREPKIFGAPGLSLMSPPPSSSSSSSNNHDDEAETSSQSTSTTTTITMHGGEQRREAPNSFLRVRIGALERNRKDLLIRFDASTNLPNFRTSLYRNMQRSYVEFQRFAEQAQLCCPQTIIPALPLPSTSAVTDEEDDRLVRIALQRWFTRICEDPILLKDDELRSFIESDFGYTPVPPPSAKRSSATSAATGVFSAALSKVVRRGPLDEDDELQSAKNALDKLEERWGSAATAINGIGKARRAYAVSNADVGAKLISLSTVESDPHLAAAERKIGRTWEHISGMMGAQAASENVILSDSLGYQALNARAAKDALIQRTTLLEDSQTATKSAINKRRNVERLKGSSKIDPVKVDDALHEMQEADALETSLSNRLNAISQNLHQAIRTHSRHAHEDVAVALLEAARMSVMYHKQHLRELEALKPDLNKIGTSAPISTSTPKIVNSTPKRNTVALPPNQTTPQAQIRRSQPPQIPNQNQTYQPQPQPPMTGPHQNTQQQQPIQQPSSRPQQPQQQGLHPPFNQQPQRPPQHQPSPIQQQGQGQGQGQGPSFSQNQSQPYYRPQQGGISQYQQQQQQASFQQQQNQGYPQQGYNQGPSFRGYPQNGPPPHMNGTQSMFLPPQSNPNNVSQRPYQSGPGYGSGPNQSDPLGGGIPNTHGPGIPNHHSGMMSQSMMLPQNGGRPATPQGGTMGRGGRKLDERQAARMLAGGF
ncbi:uncharacterized protein L201_005134 [Kwoniella dendrophila CBS 6074]|uniref:PX domain-containing protein n=1 Tax=Kwoniella dendrophila CBS 6074 TaxID=1295534 RepID=A0AAX4JYB3_9TREE